MAGFYSAVDTHSVFLPDALDPLANRFAELLELSRTIPPQEFETSSLQIELKGIEMIREALKEEIILQDFNDAVASHVKALRSGEASIFEDIQLSDLE